MIILWKHQTKLQSNMTASQRTCKVNTSNHSATHGQVQFLGIHWLMERPGKLMFPYCLQDILLQELDLVGDSARPVRLWDHRGLHNAINGLHMRLFAWGWFLHFQPSSCLLQIHTQEKYLKYKGCPSHNTNFFHTFAALLMQLGIQTSNYHHEKCAIREDA